MCRILLEVDWLGRYILRSNQSVRLTHKQLHPNGISVSLNLAQGRKHSATDDDDRTHNGDGRLSIWAMRLTSASSGAYYHIVFLVFYLLINCIRCFFIVEYSHIFSNLDKRTDCNVKFLRKIASFFRDVLFVFLQHLHPSLSLSYEKHCRQCLVYGTHSNYYTITVSAQLFGYITRCNFPSFGRSH